MDRRTFLGAVAGSFVAAPIVAGAQPAKTAPRVAFLGNGSTQLSTRRKCDGVGSTLLKGFSQWH